MNDEASDTSHQIGQQRSLLCSMRSRWKRTALKSSGWGRPTHTFRILVLIGELRLRHQIRVRGGVFQVWLYGYAHEVPLVLAEFLRVLKPSGVAVITCPDLQTVCALVADNKLTDTAYNSAAGPIRPLDILYGHSAALAACNHFIAHKTGFTEKSLIQALQKAGFQSIASKRRLSGLDLWMLASKTHLAQSEIRTFASKVFPN